MNIIEQIRERASGLKKTIVLPETADSRVLKAASFLNDENICSIILAGNEKVVRKKAQKEEIKLSDSIKIESLQTTDCKERLIANLYEHRKHKGLSEKGAADNLKNPLYFGAGLVALGRADGCVAGSVATTGEVIKAALHSIGLRNGVDIISSTFLMAFPDGRVFTYADCGVVPYPDKKQLADIAVESARTHKLLTGQKPAVAMLSYSTKGSASHERTHLVTNALEIAKDKSPDLLIDGELQFDAAYVPEVAARKAPESEVAGKANVFIFPNLDAGNIAYKITERLAGAAATGPILQGLARPMMDLSRGCNCQDIVNAACVAILIGSEGNN